MHVVGHPDSYRDETIDLMAVSFQDVEPVIDDIITVHFLNQGQPLVTCESDKETSMSVWESLFDRHL